MGISLKPRKLPENAPTPTTMAPAYFAGVRVHAVLGNHDERKTRRLKNKTITNLTKFYTRLNF
jgi:hypothetical protein